MSNLACRNHTSRDNARLFGTFLNHAEQRKHMKLRPVSYECNFETLKSLDLQLFCSAIATGLYQIGAVVFVRRIAATAARTMLRLPCRIFKGCRCMTATDVNAVQSAPPGEAGKRWAFLDGLRGVATLAVLMVHTSPLIVGLNTSERDFAFYGVRGVQLFFIVSGMALTMTYRNRPMVLVQFAKGDFFEFRQCFILPH